MAMAQSPRCTPWSPREARHSAPRSKNVTPNASYRAISAAELTRNPARGGGVGVSLEGRATAHGVGSRSSAAPHKYTFGVIGAECRREKRPNGRGLAYKPSEARTATSRTAWRRHSTMCCGPSDINEACATFRAANAGDCVRRVSSGGNVVEVTVARLFPRFATTGAPLGTSFRECGTYHTASCDSCR